MEGIPENINVGENIGNNKIMVRASDIIKKLRSPQDRRNFALENSKSYFSLLKLIFTLRLVHT